MNNLFFSKTKILFFTCVVSVLVLAGCGKTPAGPGAALSPDDPTTTAVNMLQQLQPVPESYCLTYLETLNVGTEYESPTTKEYCRNTTDRSFRILKQDGPPDSEYCVQNKGISCANLVGGQPATCVYESTVCKNPFLQNGHEITQSSTLYASYGNATKQLSDRCFSNGTGNIIDMEFCYHSQYEMFQYYKYGGSAYEVKNLVIPAPTEKFVPPSEPITIEYK